MLDSSGDLLFDSGRINGGKSFHLPFLVSVSGNEMEKYNFLLVLISNEPEKTRKPASLNFGMREMDQTAFHRIQRPHNVIGITKGLVLSGMFCEMKGLLCDVGPFIERK
jgi:hypothetical protein